jgi:hypothetical protein
MSLIRGFASQPHDWFAFVEKARLVFTDWKASQGVFHLAA